MQHTREQIDPCTIALDFQIESDVVSKAFHRAYREFAQFTHVPGFRPGKAPRSMLQKYVNEERLRERVMELLALPAYQEALRAEKITPYGDPDVEFSDLKEGENWQFKAIVTTPPKVTLGDYSDITVERPVYPVTEEDIDRQVEETRREFARMVKVEDRPVQSGDWLIADTLIAVEGETAPEEPRRSLIRIGENIPGFDEAVMGMQIDEERVFTLTYPDDYQVPERAGRRATFTVKVLSINERVLPEVTDEWVQSVTSFASVQEWREDIRRFLRARMDELATQVVESRVLEQLIQRSSIAFPGVMVQNEAQDLLEELQEDLEKQRMSYEQYLSLSGMTEEQHRAQLLQRAEMNVKSRLVVLELAKRENVQVLPAEIDAEFERIFAGTDPNDESRKRIEKSDRRRRQVADSLIQRKLRQCLLDIATITDVPVPAQTAEPTGQPVE
jgi:trigger factor